MLDELTFRISHQRRAVIEPVPCADDLGRSATYWSPPFYAQAGESNKTDWLRAGARDLTDILNLSPGNGMVDSTTKRWEIVIVNDDRTRVGLDGWDAVHSICMTVQAQIAAPPVVGPKLADRRSYLPIAATTGNVTSYCGSLYGNCCRKSKCFRLVRSFTGIMH